jgi:integrase
MNSDVVAAFRSLMPDGKKPSGRVFPVLGPKSWFESARAKAGIRNFHWHDLRHTFCSRLAMAGVPLKTIQVLAAHKTISVTAKYAHLCPNTLSGAVEKITSKAWQGREQVQNQVPTATRTAPRAKRKKGAVA